MMPARLGVQLLHEGLWDACENWGPRLNVSRFLVHDQQLRHLPYLARYATSEI
jgi:hypothetical protein